MAFVRTFGTVHPRPDKEVLGVAVKVTTEGVAKVTDIQMLPGDSVFSWSPQVGDLALVPAPKWRYINGMIQPDYDTWVMADEDIASPYRGIIAPIGAQTVQWGMLYFGDISTQQQFNGHTYDTSAGAGITPHHTARADQRLDLTTDGLMAVTVAINGIHVDPGAGTRVDTGLVVAAHDEGWAAVLGWHDNWSEVLTNHGGWA